ncbi:NusG domain II-containing protein [Wansuia hejianensis]|uniref:NusG domain II-containing protein n=1 Tax=Wansuia hejianensis TaxID=2763667 RepID=A0A926F2N1_9FIRM|nr:NusG domain II-containing protein [Wansuia hejianensis]MBC8590830.1 NusG domain II-containing protein [Wansuia hejianensis]
MTKGDKILIIVVIFFTVISLGFIKRQALSNDGKYISIQVDGKEIKKIIFDKNIEGKTFPIETEYGYNLVEIGNEKVRVIEASCPDQIDVKQGYISKIGETIVCLPNRLVVEIKGMDIDQEIDIMNH